MMRLCIYTLETPDEIGHQGNVKDKVKAIEHIDKKVVKVLLEELKDAGVNFKILVCQIVDTH